MYEIIPKITSKIQRYILKIITDISNRILKVKVTHRKANQETKTKQNPKQQRKNKQGTKKNQIIN